MDKPGEPASTLCPALGAQLRLRGAWRAGPSRFRNGREPARLRSSGCARAAPAAMEDEKSFSDICGGRVVLRRRYYSPYCREFGLSSARLSLRSLTAVTCAVWLAAYGLFTLCEVKAGARPSQAAALKRADSWVRAGVWGLWARNAVPWLDCSPSLGGCPAHPQSVPPRRTVSGCSSSVHASLPTIGRVPQNSRKGFFADAAMHVCVQKERTISS